MKRVLKFLHVGILSVTLLVFLTASTCSNQINSEILIADANQIDQYLQELDVNSYNLLEDWQLGIILYKEWEDDHAADIKTATLQIRTTQKETIALPEFAVSDDGYFDKLKTGSLIAFKNPVPQDNSSRGLRLIQTNKETGFVTNTRSSGDLD